MKTMLSAVLAFAAAAAFAADSKEAPKTVKTASPSQAVAALVSQRAPEGWKAEEYANGADSVVAFADGVDRISVRVFGAPGSGYKSPAEFLAGPAASTMGRRPEETGTVAVSGRKVALYKHGIPVNLGDPHMVSAPTTLGTELFCILPGTKGRFVVLSYARESPAPDLEGRGEKAWAAFLKTVKLVGRKT